MVQTILSLTLLMGLNAFAAQPIRCGKLFPAKIENEDILKKILGTDSIKEISQNSIEKLSQTPIETSPAALTYQRVKSYKIPNVHITHAVYYPEGQLMLIQIDHEGKKHLKSWNGSNLGDRDIALIDLRTGKFLDMPQFFHQLKDLDLNVFQNFGILQPLISSKKNLPLQLLSFHQEQKYPESVLLNKLPYQIAFIGPRSSTKTILRGATFPVRDRLIIEDTYLLLPETHPADLANLKKINDSVLTENSFLATLGDFDHSRRWNPYEPSRVRHLEKSQKLFFYPRDEQVRNYTLNSHFFAGMVKEDLQFKIRIWSPSTGKIIKDLPKEILQHFQPEEGHPFDSNHPISFSSSPMGRWLVLKSDSTFMILDGETFEVKHLRLTPDRFLPNVVFSDSENSIAFQDSYHVYVWHQGSAEQEHPEAFNPRIDLFSTKGIPQKIVLPADNIVLLKTDSDPEKAPSSPSGTFPSQTAALANLAAHLHLDHSAMWHTYKAKTKNDFNALEKTSMESVVLPPGLPSEADHVGNNTLFSFSNETDGMVPFVKVHVWGKTIEP